jgi:CheY-like chemotaxis protein
MRGRARTRKVLIIEDDRNTLELYNEAFSQIGFDAHILNGADGDFIAKVIEFNPDIISMDIMIGKEGIEDTRDGLEALELLQGDPRTREVPVIMLSNFVEEGKIRRAASLGAVDYIIASSNSPTEIAKHFLVYISDPQNYEPMHPFFQQKKRTAD